LERIYAKKQTEPSELNSSELGMITTFLAELSGASEMCAACVDLARMKTATGEDSISAWKWSCALARTLNYFLREPLCVVNASQFQ
jgi:hypothetical protein